jgi:hypothetical protein
MEVLNEEDLDWLTRAENRLVTMRKRETEHHGNRIGLAPNELSDAIKAVHNTRVWLQGRFGKRQDELM